MSKKATRKPVNGTSGGSVSGSGQRLIPRWWTAAVVWVLLLFTLALLVLAAVSGGGPVATSTFGLAIACGLVLVSALSALVRPRRWREPEVLADGSRVFRAPGLTVWPLVAAWVLLLGTAAVWAWLLVTDFGASELSGIALVVVLGAIGSLPDFVRLATGRLHRWTVILGPAALTYRGYRTDVTLAWKDVRRAVVHERGPAGVRIDVRGARIKDPVVPAAAFSVPAEQLVDEVTKARKKAQEAARG